MLGTKHHIHTPTPNKALKRISRIARVTTCVRVGGTAVREQDGMELLRGITLQTRGVKLWEPSTSRVAYRYVLGSTFTLSINVTSPATPPPHPTSLSSRGGAAASSVRNCQGAHPSTRTWTAAA